MRASLQKRKDNTMNKHTVNISSLVILLSLISFIAEACIYYFIPYHWVSVAFAAVVSVAIAHFCLESALQYGYNFLHSTFMLTATFIFSITVYMIQPNQWIHYDYSMVFLVLSNWFVPFVYCSLRNLYDHGPRFDGYQLFFHRMSMSFFLVYLFILVKEYFLTPILPPYDTLPFGAHNFVPFMATAMWFEDGIRGNWILDPMLFYIAKMICMGVPSGFFLRIYCRRMHLVFRLMIFFAVPITLELLQYATGCGRGDIDDVAMSLIGTLIGVILFHITNNIFQVVGNREFAMGRSQESKYFS